jgi:hypothetical protein
MITAFIGLDDDEDTELCIRGNGKTCSMVFYLYLYHVLGYLVWTNFHTVFSDKIIGFQEMIDTLRLMRKNGDNRKVVFGVSEMQDLLNSMGTTKEQSLYVDSFTNQLRKLNADLLYDTQIFKNVNIRLRRHTENKRIPFKYHIDGSECNFDRCEEKHIIKVFSLRPFKKGVRRILKAWEIGKLYNTNEMVIDQLILEPHEKPKKEKKEKISSEIVQIEDSQILEPSFLDLNV